MKNHYKNYSDDDIVKVAASVKSLASLLKFLGLKPAGGNYINMKRNLSRLHVNCEHWTGSAWNRGQRVKDWSDYSRAGRLKYHLIELRGHSCSKCHRTKWYNNPIPLEVHHNYGDRSNNALVNLDLVCP